MTSDTHDDEATVTVLASMATRGVLAELAAACIERVSVESIGGVDAARRVREGDPVDVVVLASKTMHALEAEAHLVPGSLADIAISSMVVAVREGTPFPDLATSEAMKTAILAAPRTGYSTGPSGEHLLRLVEAWGIRERLAEHLVQAPPGVPVGRLLAEGKVDIGVQQRSELMNLPGVAIVGPLPPAIQADTVFAAGVARAAQRPDAARRVVAYFASPAAAEAKRRNGMQPA